METPSRVSAYRRVRPIQDGTACSLSVSTDKLGLVAMRGTSLLASLAHLGVPVSRSGEGRVLEVYPGASLRVWNLPVRGYKTDAAVRSELLSTIQAQAPWLDLGPWGELCVAVDHALDALISALTARAGAKGAFVPPPVELHEVASREGWIVLPTKALADLL
jgi:predicted nuclease with RNAse H fold